MSWDGPQRKGDPPERVPCILAGSGGGARTHDPLINSVAKRGEVTGTGENPYPERGRHSAIPRPFTGSVGHMRGMKGAYSQASWP
jgi:hypothetical protein